MRYLCSLCIHGDDEYCDEFENGCCDHFRKREPKPLNVFGSEEHKEDKKSD